MKGNTAFRIANCRLRIVRCSHPAVFFWRDGMPSADWEAQYTEVRSQYTPSEGFSRGEGNSELRARVLAKKDEPHPEPVEGCSGSVVVEMASKTGWPS